MSTNTFDGALAYLNETLYQGHTRGMTGDPRTNTKAALQTLTKVGYTYEPLPLPEPEPEDEPAPPKPKSRSRSRTRRKPSKE